MESTSDLSNKSKAEVPLAAQKSAEQATKTAQSSLIQIDHDGDVIIMIFKYRAYYYEQLGEFQVSAKAISLASRALETKLNQAKPGEYCFPNSGKRLRCIKLPATDKISANIVLNLIHHKYANNSEGMSVRTLHEIATFCKLNQLDKQDAVSDIGADDHPHNVDLCQLWLWIAKVFRLDNILKECGQNAVFNTLKARKESSTGKNKVTSKQCELICSRLMFEPPKIVEAIYNQREMLIKRLTDVIELKSAAFRDAVIRGNNVCQHCADPAVRKLCDTIQMGGIFELKAKLSAPGSSLDGYTLTEICNFFKGLESRRSNILGTVFHSNCDISDQFRKIAFEVEKVDVRDNLLAEFNLPT